MADVQIYNPADGTLAWSTESDFVTIWEPKGWARATGNEVPPPGAPIAPGPVALIPGPQGEQGIQGFAGPGAHVGPTQPNTGGVPTLWIETEADGVTVKTMWVVT